MNLKKLVSVLTSKTAFVAYLILLQLLFLLSVVSILSAYSRFINQILNLLSIVMVIYIMNKDENPSYKLAWIVVIMLGADFRRTALSAVWRSKGAEGFNAP